MGGVCVSLRHEPTGQRKQPYEFAVRTPEQIVLLENLVINQDNEPRLSRQVDCYSFRHFTLYLKLDSTGTGAHHVCFLPQFAVTIGGEWHNYAQGLFASLCYEDVDTANGLWEVFQGDTAGRLFRVRVMGDAATDSLYFTINAWVAFWG